jgi:tRNA 2-selenouridine synthase SelU
MDNRRKYFLLLLSLYNHIKSTVCIVFLIAMMRSLSRVLKQYKKHVHEREVQKCVLKESTNIKACPVKGENKAS